MIRDIGVADVDAVVALVHELADYERDAESCTLTAEQLTAALFANRPALFGHVAEVEGRAAAHGRTPTPPAPHGSYP